MPKHGFMTAKAIGNRVKAKGLQKLRWFCQMCQKQCRDENGFKCHTMSESHQRMLLLVAEDPDKIVDSFSEEFEKSFLAQLKRTKNTLRVSANVFYNEYIADKEHLHMNSTRWSTLTDFVKYLGREGKCIVDETPKGWFLQFIDRDPAVLARQKELDRRNRAEKDDETRQQQIIEEMMRKDREAAEARGEVYDQPQATELKRDDGEKVEFAVPVRKAVSTVSADAATAFKAQLKAATAGATGSKASSSGTSQKRKKSALELIKEEEEAKKLAKLQKLEAEVGHRAHHKDHWFAVGIIVKVVNKKVGGGKYYKAKGVVKEVIDRYGAKVRVMDPKATLTLDQDDCETVIPKPGRTVLVLNGPYAGTEATLVSIETDTFSCTVELTQGRDRGKVVPGLPYEDVCKLDV
eukprot:m.7738 g.7738  ORF g.7738 m.7738 type:complete len:406 (+) comp2473_c0_seq1:218-1435(+)